MKPRLALLLSLLMTACATDSTSHKQMSVVSDPVAVARCTFLGSVEFREQDLRGGQLSNPGLRVATRRGANVVLVRQPLVVHSEGRRSTLAANLPGPADGPWFEGELYSCGPTALVSPRE